MSTKLGTIEKAGARLKDIDVTRIYGGEVKNECYQLTQEMEEDGYGYIQLTEQELKEIVKIINDTW